jgi:hypothetical protein
MEATSYSKIWRVDVTIFAMESTKTPSVYAVELHDTAETTETLSVAQQFLRGEFMFLATIKRSYALCKLPRHFCLILKR